MAGRAEREGGEERGTCASLPTWTCHSVDCDRPPQMSALPPKMSALPPQTEADLQRPIRLPYHDHIHHACNSRRAGGGRGEERQHTVLSASQVSAAAEEARHRCHQICEPAQVQASHHLCAAGMHFLQNSRRSQHGSRLVARMQPTSPALLLVFLRAGEVTMNDDSNSALFLSLGFVLTVQSA